MVSWNFLTPHARTMLFIAAHPRALVRDIAADVNVTERTITAVLRDLTAAGYLVRTRAGRRNRYTIQHERPLHDAPARNSTVNDLLRALGRVPTGDDTSPSSSADETG